MRNFWNQYRRLLFLGAVCVIFVYLVESLLGNPYRWTGLINSKVEVAGQYYSTNSILHVEWENEFHFNPSFSNPSFGDLGWRYVSRVQAEAGAIKLANGKIIVPLLKEGYSDFDPKTQEYHYHLSGDNENYLSTQLALGTHRTFKEKPIFNTEAFDYILDTKGIAREIPRGLLPAFVVFDDDKNKHAFHVVHNDTELSQAIGIPSRFVYSTFEVRDKKFYPLFLKREDSARNYLPWLELMTQNEILKTDEDTIKIEKSMFIRSE